MREKIHFWKNNQKKKLFKLCDEQELAEHHGYTLIYPSFGLCLMIASILLSIYLFVLF